MRSTLTDRTNVPSTRPPAVDVNSDWDASFKASGISLADREPTIIEPSTGWGRLNLRDIWRYRELLYFLTWRDVKVRYKQTALGITWVVMQPLLSTIVFTVFLGKLARVPSDGFPYPLFVYAAMLPWTFFASAVSGSGASLVGSAHLVTKVYFPRIIIPLAATLGRLVDFSVGFVILIGLMVYYGVGLSWSLLAIPILVLLLTLLALAVGIWASAVNVKFRDVAVALPVFIQFWMFVSPVVYPSSLVYSSNISRESKLLYTMNPLVGIIENFRAAVFNTAFNWRTLAIASALILPLLAYATFQFRRLERNFADVV